VPAAGEWDREGDRGKAADAAVVLVPAAGEPDGDGDIG
jgi:hypothetical protein